MNMYVYLGCFLVGMATGAFLDKEFHLAAQAVTAFQQLGIAQKGEAKIITDTQTLNKDIRNAKDPCTNAVVPPSINKRLR